MSLFNIPGIWWLLAKTLAAAILGAVLFGAAVSSMAMMDTGIGWQSVATGASAAAISGPVLLALGLAWIVVRARAARNRAAPRD
jgi:NADH:ubiquinone oxidoreductase subunit 6 (subunit J)